MDILSLNFAFFIVQLAFCIVPIFLGVRILILNEEIKDEKREKISKKLLGDSSLIKPGFFKTILFLIAGGLIIFGVIVALVLYL